MAKNSDLSVISGKLKGIRLQSPHSVLTHPMGSREKLALFNMLQPYLAGARVLDIYAGSGALGIETLSRGAKSVLFVEKSPKIAEIIRQNIQQVVEKGHLETIPGVATVWPTEGNFDIILADPPYDRFDLTEVAKLSKLLQKGGILALSFPYQQGVPEFSDLELLTERKYAAAGIAIYRKK